MFQKELPCLPRVARDCSLQRRQAVVLFFIAQLLQEAHAQMLAVKVLMEAIIIARAIAEQQRGRALLPGSMPVVFSRDVGRVWRVSEALDSGIVGINTGFISTEVAPFGGVKESGIGREGSKYGIDDWLETKYLCMAGV